MTERNDDEPANKVGYGKPPKHTQFRKGQSGNPRGRKPKMEPSRTKLQQQMDFLAIAEEEITITMNGKPKKVSGFQAAVLKLQQKVLSGDKHAMTLYFQMADKFMDEFTASHPEMTDMVETLHKGRIMQPDAIDAETIKILSKLNKRTRGE